MTETAYLAAAGGVITSGGPPYALWIACACLIAAAITAARMMTDKAIKKRAGERPPEQAVKEPRKRLARESEETEKRGLAEEYYRTEQAVEDSKAEEAYRKTFLRYARVYQALIGLNRRSQQEPLSDAFFIDAAKSVLRNANITRALRPDGFSVTANPEIIDETASVADCMKLDVAELCKELEKQRRLLLHYQGMLDCKRYLDATGTSLYQLSRETDAGKCRQLVSGICSALEREGCCALFADHPAVRANEYLRIDFADDAPDATELPGLYVRGQHGEYLRIGACGGTRRTTG